MAHKALELIGRSLSSEGQLEELEIASSPPEPPPNSATFLMDGQDERSDPRTYDGWSVSSNGRLEKLELNFLSKPPPNSATLMMDVRDERPDTTTYDDRSVSSKRQLEEKELTFSLPNPPPNSATFLMNDQDEMPDPRTYDDLKSWSFTGNEMDISDREYSEEVLSDISASESEDLDLHGPSKRARTSDSGFSGTFSMPPAWKIFAEPSLFPAYTFISRENWTLDGSVFDKEKPQELGQAFPRLELPPSATSLMDGHDQNSYMRIPNDCKSDSLVDREMDTQASEHSHKLFLWPTSSKSQEFESTVDSKPSKMAHKALELADRSLSSKGQLQEPEIAFAPPDSAPNSATFLMDGQDERSDPRTYDGRSVSSIGQLEKLELNFLSKQLPNSATLMMDGRDERPGTTTYDDSKGQLEGKELTFSQPNPPNSATFLMNDEDEMPDPRTYDDLKTWSFTGNEMDISDREDSEEVLSDISTSESEDMDLDGPSKRARTLDSGFSGTFSMPPAWKLFVEPSLFPAYTFISRENWTPDGSVFDKEKPQGLGQAFTRIEFPPSATSLMDGHDKNSNMRIANDYKNGSLVDREMDTQVPEHSQKLFLWPTSSKSQEFESTVDSKSSKMSHKALELTNRSLSSKRQLEELEIASSPPESAPNSATMLMDGQDERLDPRTYDGRSVSSIGQLEKLELNFWSKPPPNSATLMMDGRDERPGTTTYDDRSDSSKGQLEGKELTFSLPNPPPNSATFLMNDQYEMPDLRTCDDLKTWSFTGNEMDISDRENSEEVLSDISTSESEDMDLDGPSKRARTSDGGFSGTFSMPPAWKIVAEPSLFPAYTFISRENWTLDGWPGRGQI